VRRVRDAVALGWALLLAGCQGHPVERPSAALDEDAFREHLRILASDEFQGRRPGTAGEDRTVAYLIEQFKGLGLRAGNGKEYVQSVPLVEIAAREPAALNIAGKGRQLTLAPGREVVLWTHRTEPSVHLDGSEVVFVGHGVVAPEYGWDDYAGVDVRGKTVLLLSNDPGFFGGDPTLFKGRAMTYYGRWSYKFEEAARHGAAGALIIHDEAGAGFGWNVVRSTWSGPQLALAPQDDAAVVAANTSRGAAGNAPRIAQAGAPPSPAGNAPRVAVEGWISAAAARTLLGLAGADLPALQAAASTQGFRARPLGLAAGTKIDSQIRSFVSSNLLALIPGAQRPRECVVFTAHWDHLGSLTGAAGTQIFHGAVDDASGVAALLTIAQSMSRALQPPARSVLFLFSTAAEEGLLGSAYYVEHPACAMRDAAAVIDIDPAHIGGPTRDVQVAALSSSELDRYVRAAALLQGREVRPEPHPERGNFFGSDLFSFAKAGVPGLLARGGIDDAARGPVWGLAQEDDYYQHRYRQPADQYSGDWDVRGTLQDLALYLDVAERLARDWRFPNWLPNSEFRAVREKDRPQEGAGRSMPRDGRRGPPGEGPSPDEGAPEGRPDGG